MTPMDGADSGSQGREAIGKSAGKYRILKLLGEGGMGAVYLAEYPEIESQAAVKVLHAEFTANREVLGRFMDEARAVNRVKHPALVRVHDCEMESEIGAYLVMEYVEGTPLRDELAAEGRLPLQRAVVLARQMASALSAVHEKGIIHRDLKPENIMLVKDPDMVGGERVKILDFGIAKLLEDKSAISARTRTGLVMGTPLYMAPEQCSDTKNVDARADVYSLGAMAYELLSGAPPIVAQSLGELIRKQLTTTPKPLRDRVFHVPEVLDNVVLKALAVDPADRYESMQALSDALRAAMGSAASMPTPAPLNPSAAPDSGGAEPLDTVRGSQGEVVKRGAAVGTDPAHAPTEMGQTGQDSWSAPTVMRAGDKGPVTASVSPAQGGASRRKLALAAVAGLVLLGVGVVAVMGLGGEQRPANDPGRPVVQPRNAPAAKPQPAPAPVAQVVPAPAMTPDAGTPDQTAAAPAADSRPAAIKAAPAPTKKKTRRRTKKRPRKKKANADDDLLVDDDEI